MSDPELEAIRQHRLAELQSQYKVDQVFDFCQIQITFKNYK